MTTLPRVYAKNLARGRGHQRHCEWAPMMLAQPEFERGPMRKQAVKTMVKRQSSEQQKRIAATLRKMQRSEPAADLSLFKTVEEHFADIEKMRKRGHKWAGIAAGLRAIGTDISDTTLRIYFRRVANSQSNGSANVPREPIAQARAAQAVDAVPKPPVAGRPAGPSWLTSEPDEDDL
ncbi:hypothetical protein [Devosia marina]|uniref:Uncharacterized protein n=1 Tax=Devosia marina TaxID=2683198 RepID=A0A7X3FPY8_9HYPH|nr:hypothetical protein [Devosia marina]MVS98458.1 hypothetical protein [Devosia marina]